MDVVLFMCLWLDHYLHQHDGCGPAGATWLGGIATFTTTRDQCTEMIFCPNATVAGCFTWYFEFQSMLSCDLCFHWNAWLSCLDDVGLFDTSSNHMLDIIIRECVK